MNTLMTFLHVSAAIVWLGGVSFMLFALRPAAMTLPPPQRLPLMAQMQHGPFRRLRAAVMFWR